MSVVFADTYYFLALLNPRDRHHQRAHDILGERPLDIVTTRAVLLEDWSLTDCISFLAMKEFGSEEALTTDHHFEQAGFRALLK